MENVVLQKDAKKRKKKLGEQSSEHIQPQNNSLELFSKERKTSPPVIQRGNQTQKALMPMESQMTEWLIVKLSLRSHLNMCLRIPNHRIKLKTLRDL